MRRAALPVVTKPMVGPTPQRSWARRCASASASSAPSLAEPRHGAFDFIDAGIELGGETLSHRREAFGE